MIKRKKIRLKKRKPKIKFYKHKGLKCQGKKELRYLKECERYDWGLPTKAERVKTPYGYYTPDFERSERYIEIKSKGTFDSCRGLSSFMGKTKISDLQWRKIKWVAKNVKPILIRVYCSYRDAKPDISSINEPNITIQIIGGYIPKKKKI